MITLRDRRVRSYITRHVRSYPDMCELTRVQACSSI
jgi:hypothetical protein